MLRLIFLPLLKYIYIYMALWLTRFGVKVKNRACLVTDFENCFVSKKSKLNMKNIFDSFFYSKKYEEYRKH